jgi:hypothetical protein
MRFICSGSYMRLDAPDDTTRLTCPHCGQLVNVMFMTGAVRLWPDGPRWMLVSHRLPLETHA